MDYVGLEVFDEDYDLCYIPSMNELFIEDRSEKGTYLSIINANTAFITPECYASIIDRVKRSILTRKPSFIPEGWAVCENCKRLAKPKVLRVCDFCFKEVEGHKKQEETEDIKVVLIEEPEDTDTTEAPRRVDVLKLTLHFQETGNVKNEVLRIRRARGRDASLFYTPGTRSLSEDMISVKSINLKSAELTFDEVLILITDEGGQLSDFDIRNSSDEYISLDLEDENLESYLDSLRFEIRWNSY